MTVGAVALLALAPALIDAKTLKVKVPKPKKTKLPKAPEWRPYLSSCCTMSIDDRAGYAIHLDPDDPMAERIFTPRRRR
jgi:hypothetical protein